MLLTLQLLCALVNEKVFKKSFKRSFVDSYTKASISSYLAEEG